MLSILLESYCNQMLRRKRRQGLQTFNSPRVLLQRGLGIGRNYAIIFLSILLESYCNATTERPPHPVSPLSILLESYCNDPLINYFKMCHLSFNSPRVLLQQELKGAEKGYLIATFNSPRVLLQRRSCCSLLDTCLPFNSPRVLLQPAMC